MAELEIPKIVLNKSIETGDPIELKFRKEAESYKLFQIQVGRTTYPPYEHAVQVGRTTYPPYECAIINEEFQSLYEYLLDNPKIKVMVV